VAQTAESDAGPMLVFADQVLKGFGSIVPSDSDASAFADAIVKVVDAPFYKHPCPIHVDPRRHGAEVFTAVSARLGTKLLCRTGLGDLLIPQAILHPSRITADRQQSYLNQELR
jgi:hypothetical protein